MPDSEDVHEHLSRLLREFRETDEATLESSERAIAESRELLARIAREHPEID